MAIKVFVFVALFLILFINIATALPTPDDEGYFDREYNRKLINWLTSVQYPQVYNNPCKYFGTNSFSGPMPKRNSELINSLLSLPKNMNDAGK